MSSSNPRSIEPSRRYLRLPGYALVNLVAFKLLWLSLVGFQNQGLWLALPLFLLMWLGNPEFIQASRQMLVVSLTGILVDSLLSVTGVFIFPEALLPLWLIMLWFGFALALPCGLGFITRFPLWLQALTGAAASLSYLAGLQLDAVEYGYSLLQTQLLLALLWAGLVPLFVRLQKRLDRSSS